MNISTLSNILYKLHIKVPETFWKEEIVRFITEFSTERIVEVPLVLNNIPKNKMKILDVGCRYSLLPIQLASMGHDVWGIDLHNYRRKHPNFIFKKGNILRSHFKNDFFDVVVSLSTIEHIGLEFYGERSNINGDRQAIEQIHRILKPGGVFLLTLPFGKAMDAKWYRVYDRERLRGLLQGLRIRNILTFVGNRGLWLKSSIHDAEKVDSSKKTCALVFVKSIK